MEIPSLRPELGPELLKLVMLRESYILRLGRLFSRHNANGDLTLVGTLDVLRELTIQIIDLIDEWEKAQVSYPRVEPFTWNGVNYLEKIPSDLDAFTGNQAFQTLFGFSLLGNPFIIPPGVLHNDEIVIPAEGFLVFGQQPDEKAAVAAKKKDKFIKSPYNTPIINDPEVFTHLSAKNKLNQKFKGKVGDQAERDDADAGLTIAQQAALRPTVSVPGYNPYLCYISAELLLKIQKCSDKLHAVAAKSRHAKLLATKKTILDYIDDAQAQLHPSIQTSALLTPVGSQAPREREDEEDEEAEVDLDDFNKDGFTRTLRQHSQADYMQVDRYTNTHRYRITGPTDASVSLRSAGPAAYVWSPHEVYMLKQVQRKGGELFTITVTSTPGRMKTPVRKTRFDRIADEIAQLRQEIDYNSMVIEDIVASLLRMEESAIVDADPAAPIPLSPDALSELRSVLVSREQVRGYLQDRLRMLQEIFMNFTAVAEHGDLLAPDKQRERYRLESGQARPGDVRAAVLVEEIAIRKVQYMIRRKFGKALRQLEMNRRAAAAKLIQRVYRIYRVNNLVVDFIQKQRLASMVYTLYSVHKAAAYKKQLLRDKLVRDAVNLLQRVYRGYLGRKKLALKRTFVYALRDAATLVNVNRLRPGDIEELADIVEEYIADYTVRLPLDILSILRAVMYTLNNNGSEYVIMSNSDGYTEKKYIYAKTASWEAMKLILRRKGRFLRRLRGLIRHSSPPNASYLFLCSDAASHIRDVATQLREEELAEQLPKRGKHCVLTLFNYIRNVHTAYTLQHSFPEYFERSLPSWYRSLVRIKEEYDSAEIARRVENRIQYRLEECKRYQAREGKRFKHISFAIHKNLADLARAREHFQRMKIKLKSNMQNLNDTEQQQLATLEAIVRAKALALNVAEGDHREYMKVALIPDEAYLKELLYNIDNKQISMLTAQADLLERRSLFEKYQTYRDFDKICRYKHIYDYANDLGKVKADLYILLEGYKTLLEEIGGLQYVPDLRGKQLERYEVIKIRATELIQQRRDLDAIIHSELQTQYQRLFKMVLHNHIIFADEDAKHSSSKANLEIVANTSAVDSHWDRVSQLESDFEDEENRVCCKRDYEREFRSKRKMEAFSITSPHVWTPCILFVDVKLPKAFIMYLYLSLKPYCFTMFNQKHIYTDDSSPSDFTQEYTNENILNNPKLQDELQAIIDAKENIIVLVSRALHPIYYIPFDNYINNIKAVLIPNPRCLFVSAEHCFAAGGWMEPMAFDQFAYTQMQPVQAKPQKKPPVTHAPPPPPLHHSQSVFIEYNMHGRVLHSSSGGATPAGHSQERPLFGDEMRVLLHDPPAATPPPRLHVEPGTNPAAPHMHNNMFAINHPELKGVQPQPERFDMYQYDMAVGKMKKLARYFRLILTNQMVTDSAILFKAQEKAFMQAFRADFDGFLGNIRDLSKLMKADKGKLVSVKSHPKASWFMMDIVLGINVGLLFGLFDVSLVAMTEREICRVVCVLRTYLAAIDVATFCDQLETLHRRFVYKKELGNVYGTAQAMFQKMSLNDQFEATWRELHQLDYYETPARCMLVSWIECAKKYLGMTAEHEHKFVPFDQTFSPLATEVSLCLTSPLPNVTNQFVHTLAHGLALQDQQYGTVLVGELLHAFFAPLLVHKNERPIWRLSFDQDLKDSTSAQSMGVRVFNDPTLARLQLKIQESRSATGTGADDASSLMDEDLYKHLYIDDKPEIQSTAYVYHHGEELLVELHVVSTQKLSPLEDKSMGILARYSSPASQRVDVRVMSKLTINDLVVVLQPNFTEIFEGKEMNKAYLHSFQARDFYQLLTNWIMVDHFNSYLHLSVLRARYLILTKLTIINNYNLRVEIYEERFGELLICIFGLPHDDDLPALKVNANTYSADTGFVYTPSKRSYSNNLHYLRVQRRHIFKLLACCDPLVEKDKLEAFDALAMAYIFSDRIRIKPSVLWRSFLNFHSFVPHSLVPRMDIDVRYKQGPGQLVGRELLNISTSFLELGEGSDMPHIYVVLSVFEINSPSSAHELRLVLYHLHNGMSVEFRVSAMERLLLFEDSSPMIQQLVEKIKMVYTDLNEPRDRVLLDLPQLNDLKGLAKEDGGQRAALFPFRVQAKPYALEGDDEYELLSQVSDSDSENSDEEEDEFAEEEEDSNGSGDREQDVEFRDIHSGDHLISHRRDSGWGYALTFDRCVLCESRGNLIISATVNLPKRGMVITAFDPVAYRQSYRLLSWYDVQAVLGRNIAMIDDDLSNLDESSVLEMVEELLSAVDVVDSEDEGLVLMLARDKLVPEDSRQADQTSMDANAHSADNVVALSTVAQFEPVMLARIRARSAGSGPLCVRTEQGKVCRVTLSVLRARDLSKVSTFGSRNAVCVVKHNMREVGRSHVVKGSTHPDWSAATKAPTMQRYMFDMHIAVATLHASCSVDVEVFDTDAKGALKDYLGTVHLPGADLTRLCGVELSDVEAIEVTGNGSGSFALEPSKRRSDQENHHVKGSLDIEVAMRPMGKNVGRRASRLMTEPLVLAPSAAMASADVADKTFSPVYAPPDQMTYKTFYLYLLDVCMDVATLGIPRPAHSQLEVVVRVDSVERLRTSLPFKDKEVIPFRTLKATDYTHNAAERDHTYSASLYSQEGCVPVHLPAHIPVSLCHVQIEVFLHSAKDELLHVPLHLGSVELQGPVLKDLVLRSLLRQSSRQSSLPPVMSCSVLNRMHRGAGIVYTPSCINQPVGRIRVAAAVTPQRDSVYRLRICSGQGLIKADIFGKSDPFVRVLVNGYKIGQTSVQYNTLNPVWDPPEAFDVVVPFHLTLAATEVLLYVYDHDNLSDEDLLGIRRLRGDELRLLADSSKSVDATGLEESWAVFGGTVDAAHGHVWLPLYEEAQLAEVQPKGPSKGKAFGSIELNFEGPQAPGSQPLDDATIASLQRIDEEFSLKASPLERVLATESRQHFLLYLVSAKDLANADTFGKSDPYITVAINGRPLAQTRTVYDSLSPVFHEVVQFSLPAGSSLEQAMLQLDVFDEDNYTMGDFLGSLILRGGALLELSVASGVFFQQHRGRVMPEDVLAAAKSFDLQRNALFSKKANKLVKGSVQIFLREFHDSSARSAFRVEELADGAGAGAGAALQSQSAALLNKQVLEEDPFHSAVLQAVELAVGNAYVAEAYRPVYLHQVPHVSAPALDRRQKDFRERDKEDIQLLVRFNGDLVCAQKGFVHHQVVFWQSSAGDSNASAAVPAATAAPPVQVLKLQIPVEANLSACQLSAMIVGKDGQVRFATHLNGDQLQLAVDQAGAIHLPGAEAGSKGKESRTIRFSTMRQAAMRKSTVIAGAAKEHKGFSLVLASQDEGNQVAVVEVVLAPQYKQVAAQQETPHRPVPLVGPEHERSGLFVQPPMVQIGSALEEHNTHWRCNFVEEEDADQLLPDEADEEEVTPAQTTVAEEKRPASSGPPPNTNPLLKLSRGRAGASNSQISAPQTLAPGTPSTHAGWSGTDKPAILGQRHQTPGSAMVSAPTTAPSTAQPRPDIGPEELNTSALNPQSQLSALARHRLLEPFAVNFVITVKSRLEEAYRVYWRGKVVPQKLTFASQAMKKSMLASRQSKLIRTHSLQNLCITAEVHYLTETSMTEETVEDDLPICVREVLSEGPGLIRRTFRVEINTHAGVLLGSCDVQDEYAEFVALLGRKGGHLVFRQKPRVWDYPAIFAFIVRERMQLNLLSAGVGQKEGGRAARGPGRREAVVQAMTAPSALAVLEDGMPAVAKGGEATVTTERAGADEDADRRSDDSDTPRRVARAEEVHSGSVITLQRDPVDDVEAYLHQLRLEEDVEDDDSNTSDDSDGHDVFARGSASVTSRDAVPAGRWARPGVDRSLLKDTKRTYYLRIHSRTHRLTGRQFRTMVLCMHKAYRHPWAYPRGSGEGGAGRSREGSLSQLKSRSNSIAMNFGSIKSVGSLKITASRSNSVVPGVDGGPTPRHSTHSAQVNYAVLLDGLPERTVDEIKMLADRPDEFFAQRSLEESLDAIVLLFRCHDVHSRVVYNIKVLGSDVAPIVREVFSFDSIATKFRREKLARALMAFLVLRFEPKDVDEMLNNNQGADAASQTASHTGSSVNLLGFGGGGRDLMMEKSTGGILGAAFGVHMVLPLDRSSRLEQLVAGEKARKRRAGVASAETPPVVDAPSSSPTALRRCSLTSLQSVAERPRQEAHVDEPEDEPEGEDEDEEGDDEEEEDDEDEEEDEAGSQQPVKV